MGEYQYWIQFKIINIGISLLPKEFRNHLFIRNCLKTGHIKAKDNTGGRGVKPEPPKEK